MRFSFSKGINPSRFLGISYNKCMYPLRKDGRPTITCHLVFKTFWLKLPYKHIAGKEHGSAIKSYGFVLSCKQKYLMLNLGYNRKRLM